MEGFKVADRFSLRRQCIMPGELGFYDLMDPNTRRRQGELANVRVETRVAYLSCTCL